MNAEFYTSEIDPAKVTAFKEYLTESEYFKFEREHFEAQIEVSKVLRKYNDIVSERISKKELIKAICQNALDLEQRLSSFRSEKLNDIYLYLRKIEDESRNPEL